MDLSGYSILAVLLQWGVGMVFALGLLSLAWPDLHPGFGTILAAGFVGGHGTAAAIGPAFAAGGWQDAQSLAMTSATVGVVGAVVGGVLWVRWASACCRRLSPPDADAAVDEPVEAQPFSNMTRIAVTNE